MIRDWEIIGREVVQDFKIFKMEDEMKIYQKSFCGAIHGK
jgi:hypothetical protein